MDGDNEKQHSIAFFHSSFNRRLWESLLIFLVILLTDQDRLREETDLPLAEDQGHRGGVHALLVGGPPHPGVGPAP